MPAPKSLAQHEKDGTRRNDRHGSRMEAAFQPGKPRATTRVPKSAAWLWKLVVDQFPAESLTTLDAANLEAACRWWAEWDHYQKQISAPAVRGSSDEYKVVMLAVAAWKQCEKILSQYGMSPAARMRLKQSPLPEAEEDALSQLKLVGAKRA